MKEKMYYIVGDTHNGKFYEQFDSYNEAMAYIKGEYTYDKAHEGEPYNTFIDGYYGIYRISADTAEYYGWDYVYANWETADFLGAVTYKQAMDWRQS